MKKVLLCLALLLWPALSLAAPPTPYDTDTMLYYPRLTASQQALFDLVYDAAARGEARVDMPDGTSYDDACLVMELLLLDCPELCALDTEYSVSYLQSRPEEAVSLNLRYTMPASAGESLVEAARAMADQAYGDEFQREWILHDMLCAQVSYDLQAENCHSAWGALMDGRAVCDGYARAMALLLRLSYIRCGVVRGISAQSGENHAWNLVNVDGAWAWLDPTNNDQPEMITYFYFNLSDRWLARSYVLRESLSLPACTDESVSWHAKTWRLVQRTEDMELHIFNNFRNLVQQGSLFNLRFENRQDYLSLRDNVSAWADRYNRQGGPGAYGFIRTWYSDEQQCVVVELEK